MATESNLVRICSISESPAEGNVGEYSAGKLTVCLAKLNGKISALDNECPHHGGPLGEGIIEDGKVVCPWHAYAFDLTTGLCADARLPSAQVYEVRVAGDDVLVKV